MSTHNSAIQQHPSVRLLLPLMAGIVLGDFLSSHAVSLGENWCLAIMGAAWLLLLVGYVMRKHWKHFFGIALNLCLMGCGYVLTSRQLTKTDFLFTDQPQAFMAVVQEVPQEKPRTFMLDADVSMASPQTHRFLLYIAKDSASSQIQRGDSLWVYARLQAPNNDAMTDGFDYVSYLKRKGITGTAYVARNHWRQTGHRETISWIQLLQDFRAQVVERYHLLGFEGDELAVLAALTTGIKEDLSDELREAYSVAGVSHVLALSGLHIGLIYGFMLLLLTPLWKRSNWAKAVSILFMISVLWLFAVFTGLSASVVRSVIMFSIHAIAMFREERPASLHILAVTAFLMLLCRPLWLFDISFQLSFVAVASIILLQPRISALLPQTNNWLLNRGKDLLTVSIAAQVGTAPLVILYFHRFSMHFLLSNLLILPLVTVVMYLAFLMILLSPWITLQQWVADVLQPLLHGQNALLSRLSSLPAASIDGMWTNTIEILLFYWVVYLFIQYLDLRTARRAINTLFVAWVLVCCHLVSAIIPL